MLETQQSDKSPMAIHWNCKYNSVSYSIHFDSLTQSSNVPKGTWPVKLPENIKLSFWIDFFFWNSSVAISFDRGIEEK